MSLHPVVTGQKSVSFFSPSSLLTHTHHLPVAPAGHHTSSVPADPGTGISADAAESQPPASSSSPPALPSPSPPPTGGHTPLVSVIHSGKRVVGRGWWEEGGGRRGWEEGGGREVGGGWWEEGGGRRGRREGVTEKERRDEKEGRGGREKEKGKGRGGRNEFRRVNPDE